MDDLQDAIGDAVYETALEKRPKLRKPFPLPPADKLEQLLEEQIKGSTMSSGPLSFPSLLNSYVGYYVFRKFMKSNIDVQALSCIEKIQDYQNTPSSEARVAMGKDLIIFLNKHKESVPIDIDHDAYHLPDLTYNPFVFKAKLDSALFEACEIEGLSCNKTISMVKQEVTSALLEKLTKDNSSENTTVFDSLYVTICKSIANSYWKLFLNSPEACKEFIGYKYIAENHQICDNDFFQFRTLGQGGFGAVCGVENCFTSKMLAQKAMNKARIKSKDAEDLVLVERETLAKIDSPFVLSLKYAFQTKDDVLLLMDIMTGGDLSYHLEIDAKHCFDEERTKFYAAQVLLGIEHLHSLNLIYRDLKPGNILLSQDGNAVITDLGLVCDAEPALTGLAGTRGYWAPEMLLAYNKSKGKNRRSSISSSVRDSPAATQKKSLESSPNTNLRASSGGEGNTVIKVTPSIDENVLVEGEPLRVGTPVLEIDKINPVHVTDSHISPMVGSAIGSRRATVVYNKNNSNANFGSENSAPLINEAIEEMSYSYGKEVDYFSYGCLIYEMLYGRCPFRTREAKSLVPDSESKSMDKAVMSWEPEYKDNASAEAIDFMKRLLKKKPEERMGHNGANEVKQHPWFKKIDWLMIERGLATPPFKPSNSINASSASGIEEFEPPSAKIIVDNEIYKNWDYINKTALEKEIVQALHWKAKPAIDSDGKPIIKSSSDGGCCSIS